MFKIHPTFPKIPNQPVVAIQPGSKRKRAELFVCDNCGMRKRLDRGKRHWCDNCSSGSSFEMRPVKESWRKPAEKDRAGETGTARSGRI
jgi:predicted amidophosphoribosyltransferase